MNLHDITSPYARLANDIVVERLDQRDDEDEGHWKEALVEDRRAGPAETAAARIDLAAWLQSLPQARRRIAMKLAMGETTGEAAKAFGVSAARISQLRNELAAVVAAVPGRVDRRWSSYGHRLSRTPPVAFCPPPRIGRGGGRHSSSPVSSRLVARSHAMPYLSQRNRDVDNYHRRWATGRRYLTGRAPRGRASWSGLLRFSLVAVPIKAYPAHTASDAISFNQLHAGCGERIRYQKHCPVHGQVDGEEIAKGYQYAPDQYVIVESSELEQLRPAKEKALSLEQFVDPQQIDPVVFSGRTLYLVPDGLPAQRPYLVLAQAMQHAAKGAGKGHHVGAPAIGPGPTGGPAAVDARAALSRTSLRQQSLGIRSAERRRKPGRTATGWNVDRYLQCPGELVTLP